MSIEGAPKSQSKGPQPNLSDPAVRNAEMIRERDRIQSEVDEIQAEIFELNEGTDPEKYSKIKELHRKQEVLGAEMEAMMKRYL